MPVILIAIIVMLSLQAFIPGTREERAGIAQERAAVPATQLQAWHAAAVRACFAGGTACAAGRIDDNAVKQRMPSYMDTASKAYQANRFGSFSTGDRVLSVYTGLGENNQANANSATAEAAAALARMTAPDGQTSVGYYDAVQTRFVPRSYTALLTLPDGTVQAVAPLTPPVPANAQAYFTVAVPNGAPMIGTRTR